MPLLFLSAPKELWPLFLGFPGASLWSSLRGPHPCCCAPPGGPPGGSLSPIIQGPALRIQTPQQPWRQRGLGAG